MKTNFLSPLAALVPLLMLCGTVHAQFMDIRVSIKVIRNSAGSDPVNSSPPAGGYGDETINLTSDANIEAQIAFSNAVFANTGRGLRFVLSEPVQHIQPAAPSGQPPNFWYDIDARSSATRDLIEAAAIGNTAVWRWRTNAVNYYIHNTSSGSSSRAEPGGTSSRTESCTGSTQPIRSSRAIKSTSSAI